jgi:pantoate--beta-alanine ligase
MRIIHSLSEMTETARGWLAGGSVGFVPTMGYLHEGHAALYFAAQQECEISVVSIFVNPLQFSSEEDFARYPRNLSRDLQLLHSANIDVVFLPGLEEMFPPGFASYVTPFGPVAEQLAGAMHPTAMRGVATVATKLFQLVRPDVAYFGQRDAQQVAVIRQVVRDLNIDITLRILPAVRSADGLALSSRNTQLSPPEWQAASSLYRALLLGKAHIEQGERSSAVIKKAMLELLATEPLVAVDYVAICYPDTFEEIEDICPPLVLVVAAHLGQTRLSDTILWLGDDSWLL